MTQIVIGDLAVLDFVKYNSSLENLLYIRYILSRKKLLIYWLLLKMEKICVGFLLQFIYVFLIFHCLGKPFIISR